MAFRPTNGRAIGPATWKVRAFSAGVTLVGLCVYLNGLALPTSVAKAAPPDATPPSSELVPSHGGTLVIGGGGDLPELVRDRFVELAGGPQARIIVIPTAHSVADRPEASAALDPWMGKGAASVRLLHTRSKEQANDSAFVQPLTEATGVWLGGGQQQKLTEAYLGTEVERQLKRLLDRGGVIGGSSAGAAVMTRVMITRGRMQADVGEGFDLLPGAVVDQHFLKRNRLSRLLSVLSDHPDLVGLGIDEQTAVVFHVRSRLLSVIGDSFVIACVPGSEDNPARLEVLKSGDKIDLASLREAPEPGLTIAPALGSGSP
jgi:cyanophycinase